MKRTVLLLAILAFAAFCSAQTKNKGHRASQTSDTLDFEKAFLLIKEKGRYQSKVTSGDDRGGYAYRLKGSRLWVYAIPYAEDSMRDDIGIQADTIAFSIYRDGAIEAGSGLSKQDSARLNQAFDKCSGQLISWVRKN